MLYFDDWPVSVASVAYLYSKKVRRSWFHIDTMTHTLVDYRGKKGNFAVRDRDNV